MLSENNEYHGLNTEQANHRADDLVYWATLWRCRCIMCRIDG